MKSWKQQEVSCEYFTHDCIGARGPLLYITPLHIPFRKLAWVMTRGSWSARGWHSRSGLEIPSPLLSFRCPHYPNAPGTVLLRSARVGRNFTLRGISSAMFDEATNRVSTLELFLFFYPLIAGWFSIYRCESFLFVFAVFASSRRT